MNGLREHCKSVRRYGSRVESHRSKLAWLSNCGAGFLRIANFGCDIGHETVALAWWLGAREVVGIDKDLCAIRQAQSELAHFRKTLKEMGWLLPPDASPETRSLIEQLRNRTVPRFAVADMADSTGLRSDHFDLCYCHRVLYLIRCGNSGSDERARSAIQEMARVTKPGGLVTAIEPTSCSPGGRRSVLLDKCFVQAGLVEFDNCENLFSARNRRTYLYAKPARATLHQTPVMSRSP